MRYKYLHLLKLWSIPYKLTKEIEVDETYITHCRKGRKIEGHPGKKRGTPARKKEACQKKRYVSNSGAAIGKLHCSFF